VKVKAQESEIKLPNYRLRRIITLMVVLVLVAMTSMGVAWRSGSFRTPVVLSAAPVPNAIPLRNSCSAGYVTFTFDDGPGPAPGYEGNTQAVINALVALHVPAVFFVIGTSIDQNPLGPEIIREEVKYGFLVENHTYTHDSFTGFSTHTKPMTNAQVITELVKGNEAIEAAGAPKPTLWRPPFGDVTAQQAYLASTLGLRTVTDYSDIGTNTLDSSNILDSRDWEPISPAQIAQSITSGYYQPGPSSWAKTQRVLPIHAGDILAFHDGDKYAAATAASLQPIVIYMNAHHLCATTTVPADGTGGMVPNYPVKGD
jgi:peptidoglycan/xylan/chitin deacetylase (PgdA/CDA1 family)